MKKSCNEKIDLEYSQPVITNEQVYPTLESKIPQQETDEDEFKIKFDDPQPKKEMTLNEPVITTIVRDK